MLLEGYSGPMSLPSVILAQPRLGEETGDIEQERGAPLPALRPMTQDEAETIAAWRYEPPFDFYDASNDTEDLEELLDREVRGDRFFSVTDEDGALVGFFSFTGEDGVLTIGLGMRPDLTGRGLGRRFLQAGLEHARAAFAPASFLLHVASFNVRAVRLYESAGFRKLRTYMRETNGGKWEFHEMSLIDSDT
jgi:ribosomal-protein-alanine N-acetyltransferase